MRVYSCAIKFMAGAAGDRGQLAREKSRWDTRIANALRFIRALRNYFYDIFFLFFSVFSVCVCERLCPLCRGGVRVEVLALAKQIKSKL